MNIFDEALSASERVNMYRAEVIPELYPHERGMRVSNWHPEDQLAYVGGDYTRYENYKQKVVAGV